MLLLLAWPTSQLRRSAAFGIEDVALQQSMASQERDHVGVWHGVQASDIHHFLRRRRAAGGSGHAPGVPEGAEVPPDAHLGPPALHRRGPFFRQQHLPQLRRPPDPPTTLWGACPRPSGPIRSLPALAHSRSARAFLAYTQKRQLEERGDCVELGCLAPACQHNMLIIHSLTPHE